MATPSFIFCPVQRAVLTSSAATETSHEKEGIGIYTRYIVEGIETGAADTDDNGVITVEEIHDYAEWKTKEEYPGMNPQIFTVKEGYKIKLAKAPVGDYKLEYRKILELWVQRRQGQFSPILLNAFEEKRKKLGLSPEEAEEIIAEVLQPSHELEEKLLVYKKNYYEAIKLDFPPNEEAKEELKFLQQTLGLRDRDVKSIEREINENPSTTSAGSYFERGFMNYKEGNNEGAIRNYRKAVELKKEYSVAHFNLGLIHYAQKNYQEAIEEFTEAISQNSEWGTVNIAEAYLQRGLAYYDSGIFDAAILNYTKSLQERPTSSLTYYERGLAHYNLQNYQAAVDDYTEAIEINGESYELDDVKIYFQRGLAYYALDNKQASLEDWSKVITLKPNYSVAFYNIGLIYDYKNQHQEALDNYTQAIKYDCDWGELKISQAYYRRATDQYKLGRLEAAVDDYTKAIEIEPELADAYEGRGDAYRGLSKRDAAIEDYQTSKMLYQGSFRNSECSRVQTKIRDLNQLG